jgi:hypothetical protein
MEDMKRKQLAKLRNDYIVFALENLSLAEESDRQLTARKLAVNFCFPNLNDQQREILCDLAWRLTISKGLAHWDLLDKEKRKLLEEIVGKTHRQREKWVKDYAKLHDAVMTSDLLDKLTPLQEKLIMEMSFWS